MSFVEARNHILGQLRQNVTEIVVSTNVSSRKDGLPYVGQREPDDPAVAVYWVEDGVPRVVACDVWQKARENLRAVGMAITALRQLQRSGATQVVERAFAGFLALPANGSTTRVPWRDVMGFDPLHMVYSWMDVKEQYRALAILRHPDNKATGSAEAFRELNQAFEDAKAEFNQGDR